MWLLAGLARSKPLDEPGDGRRSRAATAQIESARLVMIFNPRTETVPVKRAEQAPRSDGAHVNALLLEPLHRVPRVEQPAQLRLAMATKMHLGHGLRQLVTF